MPGDRKGKDIRWCIPSTKMKPLTQSSALLWTGQCFIFFQGVVFQVGIREGICQYVSERCTSTFASRFSGHSCPQRTVLGAISKLVSSSCPQRIYTMKGKSASAECFVLHSLPWPQRVCQFYMVRMSEDAQNIMDYRSHILQAYKTEDKMWVLGTKAVKIPGWLFPTWFSWFPQLGQPDLVNQDSSWQDFH